MCWPSSGKPAAHPTHPPLLAHVAVMLAGGVLSLAMGHPAPGLAAAGACGLMFTFSQRGLRKPVVSHIREQLLARPECLHLWGSDAPRVRAAGVLCAAVARVMRWPNAHFIPDDPIELAFYELTGVDKPIDIFEALVETTKKLGTRMKWSDFAENIAPRVCTLGELLDAAMARGIQLDEMPGGNQQDQVC